MRVIEPKWEEVTDSEFLLNTYSEDPDEWVIYEKNEKGYYPSFIRYGKFVFDIGKKVNIEVADNGFIIKQGQNTYIHDGSYGFNDKIHELTYKIVEKERQLTEDEIQELIQFTLEVNAHFAKQSLE